MDEDGDDVFPSPRYSQFTQAVRAFRPSQLIPLLARMTARPDPNYHGYADIKDFPPWIAAAIARESVVRGNEHRNREPSERDVRRLVQLHHSVFNPASVSTLTSIIGPSIHEQMWWQQSIFEEQMRSLSLLDDDAWGEKLDWTAVLGMSLEDAIGAAFIVGITFNSNGGRWHPDLLDKLFGDPRSVALPSRNSVEQVLQFLTASVAQLREAGQAWDGSRAAKDPELEKHPLNPLMRHPVVDLGGDGLWAPVGPLVYRALLPDNLYVIGRQHWRDTFTPQLGRRHEKYVGELFRNIATDLVGELRYGKGGGQKTIDWFWITPEAVVMIECKSAGLSIDSLAGGGRFSDLVEQYLVKGRQQIETTARHVVARTPGLEAIPSDRRMLGLVVTSSPFHFANARLPEYRTVDQSVPTLIASDRAIERLTSLPPDVAITALIEIFDDPERSRWDLEQSLKTYEPTRHPLSERAWQRIKPVQMLEIDEPDESDLTA